MIRRCGWSDDLASAHEVVLLGAEWKILKGGAIRSQGLSMKPVVIFVRRHTGNGQLHVYALPALFK